MNLENLREEVHARHLLTQRVDSIIHSDNFEVCYLKANEDMRQFVADAAKKNKEAHLKEFIQNTLAKCTPFEQLGIRKLREMAKHLKVKNYHLMRKVDLVEEINVKVQRIKASVKRVAIQSEELRQTSSDNS